MPAAQHNDAELVAECLEGRWDAFGRIVERYQSLICSLTYCATGSLSGSEDLAQEVFVTAWKQLPGLGEPAKLRPWLCGIARNIIGKTLRRDGHEPLQGAEPLEAAQGSVAAEPLPPERLISKEEEAILWRSVERIPELYREPLVLFYREHQSVEKVAAALELTEDTVRQRLSRGRKLLHEQVLAFVEGALEETNPGKAFTLGVLAALPLLAASATGATAATAGAVAAKGSATAKTATGVAAVGAVLTGGVIFYFSLLGFLAFLGGCIGYIMGRAVQQSARQLEYVSRFWRSLAVGFAVFVGLPWLLAFGLRLPADSHSGLYHGLTLWMGLIYLLVPAALALWLLRWWRGSAQTNRDAPGPGQTTRKRFFLWLAFGMLFPAYRLTLWLLMVYPLVFDQLSVPSHRLSGAEFQRIVTERKDAEFKVTQYKNGSKTLSIKLPEGRKWAIFYMPAEESTLALLAENHIAYQTYVAGRDFDRLGMPPRFLGLLAFFVAPAGAVLLLMRPGRREFYQQQIDPRQAEKAASKARKAFRAFAVSMALALLAAAIFLALFARWGTRTLSAAEVPKIAAEHRFARFMVSQFDNGSRELRITPRERGIGPFVAPADEATLSVLAQQGIPYSTIVQGRDFGHGTPSPLFLLVCIVMLTTGAVSLLWWAGKGVKPWSPAFRAGFLVVFVLLFGASILCSRDRSNTYVSTVRVKVAEWSNPAFPDDETGIIESKEVLGKVVEKLDLNRKWGRRWSHWLKLTPDETLEQIKRFNLVRVDLIPLGQTGVIEVSVYDVYDNDGQEAAAVGNAIADTYRDYRNHDRPVAQIMEAAVPGQTPLPRFKPAMLVIGAVAGVLLGLLAGAAAARWQAWRTRR